MAQVLWVDANLKMDQDEKEELISTVLEDLHFWMNPEIYKAAKEREELGRDNVLYERQIMQMESGNFEDNDPKNYWEID